MHQYRSKIIMQIRFVLLISLIALCRAEEEVEDIREIAKSNPVSIKSLGAAKKEEFQNKPSSVHKAFVVQENAAGSGLNSFINPPQIQRGQFAPNLNPTGIGSGLLNPGSFGGLPQGFGGGGSLPVATGGAGSGQQPQNSGILNVLNSLGKQLTGAVGLNGLLPQAGQPSGFSGPQIPRIPGQLGPQSGALPNVPGLPLLPGAAGPNGQIDFFNLFSAISRRAFNGSSLADIIPPIQAQKFADNITDTLLPSTAKLDLARFMGRWFEGINSPRATDQRCVVHHYGGLTENGKTATFTALKIYREGSEFGQVRYSIGYAFRGGRQGGMLQMHSSEATDPTPYWIYRVGPSGKDAFGNEQYEYAIVSNWIRYPVMVLVRDPDQFHQKHEEEVLRWLEDNQFVNGFTRAFNLVQPADYANCQYADSAFEIFG